MSLRDFLLSSGAETESVAPLLSSDGIKLAFDVVRNYGLALAVLFGALEFARLAEPVTAKHALSEVFIVVTIKIVLFLVAAILFLLNVLFSTYVFERTPFYRARSEKFGWIIFSVILSSLLSLIISAALILARQHAA